jgi:hypothetical protein
VARLDAAQPMLVGVGVARDLLPGITDRTLLHAGPPIEWADMSGPLRGAIVGAAVYERLASDHEQAERMAAAGEFEFGPCHERGAVGPMAGVVSPSMPMCIVENATHGNRAFCTFNEGLGKVLRYGRNDAEVLERLAWIRDVLARVFSRALREARPARRPARDDRPGAADGRRGPQPQPRRALAAAARAVPVLVELDEPSADVAAVARFVNGNDHFFLEPDDAGVQGGGRRGRPASSAPRSSRRWPATAPSSACA